MTVNSTADGTIFISGNLYTAPVNRLPEGKIIHGANREILCIWPLREDMKSIGTPFFVRCPRYEFGPSLFGTALAADHPIGATVRLKDGKWHNLLAYRVLDMSEMYYGTESQEFSGCYIDEVVSGDGVIEPWLFQEKQERKS